LASLESTHDLLTRPGRGHRDRDECGSMMGRRAEKRRIGKERDKEEKQEERKKESEKEEEKKREEGKKNQKKREENHWQPGRAMPGRFRLGARYAREGVLEEGSDGEASKCITVARA
jgi:hypothetical protein